MPLFLIFLLLSMVVLRQGGARDQWCDKEGVQQTTCPYLTKTKILNTMCKVDFSFAVWSCGKSDHHIALTAGHWGKLLFSWLSTTHYQKLDVILERPASQIVLVMAVVLSFCNPFTLIRTSLYPWTWDCHFSLTLPVLVQRGGGVSSFLHAWVSGWVGAMSHGKWSRRFSGFCASYPGPLIWLLPHVGFSQCKHVVRFDEQTASSLAPL
jgi:hypothetical protein